MEKSFLSFHRHQEPRDNDRRAPNENLIINENRQSIIETIVAQWPRLETKGDEECVLYGAGPALLS